MSRVVSSALVCLIVLLGVAALALCQGEGVTVQKISGEKNYEFRQCRNSMNYFMVRFNPNTGEVWKAPTTRWEKCIDTEKPPAGPYDVQLIDHPTRDSYWIFRQNLRTGQAWHLSGGTWKDFREPSE